MPPDDDTDVELAEDLFRALRDEGVLGYASADDVMGLDVEAMRAIMGDVEKEQGGGASSSPELFGGASTPTFETPERRRVRDAENAAMARRSAGGGFGERVDYGSAPTASTTVAGPEVPYDPAAAEDVMGRSAKFVIESRKLIAQARARLRGGSVAVKDDPDGMPSTPKSASASKTPGKGPASTPATPGEREQRGLRHFSMRVCEKVEEKQHTTYNVVANELVEELRITAMEKNEEFDEKNVRRRVYDALNVLEAVNIITKKKKEIFWKGFPPGYVKPGDSPPRVKAPVTPHSAVKSGEEWMLSAAGIDAFEKKVEQLAEIVDQHDAVASLIKRNREALARDGPPVTGIQLPFILIQTRPNAQVDVEISDDQRMVHLDFNQSPFQIHDGYHVLTKMLKLHTKRIPDRVADAAQGAATTSQPSGAPGGTPKKAKTPTPTKAKTPTPTKRKTPTQKEVVTASPASAKDKRARKT